ncbi:MAG: molybdopterin dinucleotide binding domain-containing protein [Dehalococcoidia bacterium]|nr:molybdopterin-dependent oxidoreductase [Chloroflexota bacterium]
MSSLDNNKNLSRRKFLGLVGGTALGAFIFEACGVPEQEFIIQAPVDMPEDYVKGEDDWYATLSDTSSHGESLIVRIMQGRAKKIEGNPDFPNTLGKHKTVSETELQSLYHPDRISGPLYRKTSSGNHRPISWNEAKSIINNSTTSQSTKSIITKPLRGLNRGLVEKYALEKNMKHLTLASLRDNSMYESAKDVFGTNDLPYFDIKNSDLIISFGLDFLGSWGPVEYEYQFGKFRSKDERGYLYQIEPRMSLTAAAADKWLCSEPGKEGLIALLIADSLSKNEKIKDDDVEHFKKIAGIQKIDEINNTNVSLDAKSVGKATGIDYHVLEKLIEKINYSVDKNKKIMFLSGGCMSGYSNSRSLNSLVYGLNYLTDSINNEGGIIINPENELGYVLVNGEAINMPSSSSWNSHEDWSKEIETWESGSQDLVIINNVDLVNEIPGKKRLINAINKVKLSIGFGIVVNDTLERCDLILPSNTALQSWSSDIPEPKTGYQSYGFGQPVATKPLLRDGSQVLYDSKSFNNVLLDDLDGNLSGVSFMDICKQLSDTIYDSDSYKNSSIVASNKDDFFRGIMARGGWWNTNQKPVDPKKPKINVVNSVSNVKKNKDEFYLIPFKSHVFGDGNSLSNPWALGSPDPLTSITWDTWVEMNSKTAENLNIKAGDIVEVKSKMSSIELPVYVHPAVPTNSVAVPIGLGKENFTRYASGRGANVVDLIDSSKLNENGDIMWNSTTVVISKTEDSKKISKFEGNVPAVQIEPGVPILTLAPGETAEEGFHRAHEEHLEHTFGDHFGDEHNSEKGDH